MPYHPEWIKKLARERGSETPSQYTVIKRYPSSRQFSPQGVGNGLPPPVTIHAGAGSDGVIQRDRPAVLDRGSYPASVYHEGEPITIGADGVRKITPAQQSAIQNMDIPQTVQGQQRISEIQQQNNLPGYADGGVTYPRRRARSSGIPTTGNPTAEPQPITVENPTIPSQTPVPQTITTPQTIGSETRGSANPAIPFQAPVPQTITAPQTISSGTSRAANPVLPTLSSAPSTPSSITKVPEAPKVGASVVPGRTDTMSDLGKKAVRTGLESTIATARGENPYLQEFGRKALTDQSAASAAAKTANQMTANRQGVSTSVQNAMNAEMNRNAEGTQGNLRSDIYNAQQTAAIYAANQAVSQGQQVRQFEDVTMPQTASGLKTDEVQREQMMKNIEQTAANTKLTEAQIAGMKDDKTAAASTASNNRLKSLWSSGESIESMISDKTLRESVKTELGENASKAEIDKEIGLRYKAFQSANHDVLDGGINKGINTIIENNQDLNAAFTDDTIVRDTAAYLKINDLTDSENIKKIQKEISDRFTEMSKPDVVRAYENIMENVISPTMPELSNNPEFKKDMMNVLADLELNNDIEYDDKGNVVFTGITDWPWQSPDTYFKYNDWNGKEVLGGEYDKTQKVAIEGNGTQYKNTAGKPVTMADLDSAWNSPLMSKADRESYFDERGMFDRERFMKDKGFLQKAASGNTISTVEQYETAIIESEPLRTAMIPVLQSYNTMYNKGTIKTGEGPTVEEGGSAVTSTASEASIFLYNDENGNESQASVMDNMGYILYQFSENSGLDAKNGELLDAFSFSTQWKGGKGWYVNSSTMKVENLWDPGYKVPPPLVTTSAPETKKEVVSKPVKRREPNPPEKEGEWVPGDQEFDDGRSNEQEFPETWELDDTTIT